MNQLGAALTAILLASAPSSRADEALDGCVTHLLRAHTPQLIRVSSVQLHAVCSGLRANDFKFDTRKQAFIDMFDEEAPVNLQSVLLRPKREQDLFVFASSRAFGARGEATWVSTRLKNGSYSFSMGVATGGAPRPLKRVRQGYPDLLISPGVCDAVWSWDGERYSHKCNVSTAETPCTPPVCK